MSKVALVSGGTRGIGFATAAALVARGDRVALFCRHAAHAREAVRRLGAGAKTAVLALAGDVRAEKDMAAVVGQTVERFGRIDLLVNNAGIALYGPAHETTAAKWAAVIDTNLTGAFLLSRQVLPLMRTQGSGVIVNVCSRMAVEPVPLFAAYCASKFGLVGLTKVLAQESGDRGILVHAVLPGAVDTTMARDLAGRERPPRPELSPEDVAARILEAAEHRAESGVLFDVRPRPRVAR